MRWLIDADLLIEAERGDTRLEAWLTGEQTAVADVTRGEFLVGVYQVKDPARRQRGESFYRGAIAPQALVSTEAADFTDGARLAGEARRENRGAPSLLDGVLAAIALRTGAGVATRNMKDFAAMGCPVFNPLERSAGQ